jgi:chromosome segregation ATPase
MSEGSAGQDDALMAETRQLLNALNEENAELKQHNHDLSRRVRDGQEELRDEKRRFAALEHDAKQINFSKQQELHAAAAAAKAAAAQLSEAKAACDALRGQAATAAERADDTDHRVATNDRRAADLERQVVEMRQRTETTEADADRRAEELSAAGKTHRDRLSAEKQHHEAAVAQLRADLGRALDDFGAEQQRADDATALVTGLRREFAAERKRLEAAAARTLAVEGDLEYAHGQMGDIAAAVLQQLDDMQRGVRGAIAVSDAASSSVADALGKCQEQRHLLTGLRDADETVLSMHQTVVADLQAETAAARRDAAGLRGAGEAATQRIGATQREVAETVQRATIAEAELACVRDEHAALRREHDELRNRCRDVTHDLDRANDAATTTRVKLQQYAVDADDAAEHLATLSRRAAEAATAHAEAERALQRDADEQRHEVQRAHAALQQQQHANDAEVDHLRGLLDGHTRSLAMELQRLQGGSRSGSVQQRSQLVTPAQTPMPMASPAQPAVSAPRQFAPRAAHPRTPSPSPKREPDAVQHNLLAALRDGFARPLR